MAITVTVDQLRTELKRQRGEKGLSLRDVEGLTGISATTLSRIERGSPPDLDMIERLAKWLKVNVSAVETAKNGIKTDEDLKKTIAVHLRASRKLPEDVATSIADAFDLVMKIELERRTQKKS